MSKNKYWTAVLYPENMIDTWESDIGDIVQVPYAYCIHDVDLTESAERRKRHVHIILAFPNTTTYKHALSVFQKLSLDGLKALNTCEPVINIRHMYDYLIHNTDECRKKKKLMYDPSCRKTGNNFDIGSFEQISVAEKEDMYLELSDFIINHGFTNYADFWIYARKGFDKKYMEVIKTYSGHFDRLCKGNFHRFNGGS